MPMDSPDMGADEITPYNSPFITPLKQEPSVELIQQQADIVKKLSFVQKI